MPNLVELIRNRILAQHPAAQVVERGERHVRYLAETLPDGRQHFVWRGGSLLHYWDGNDWQEINTDWQDSAEVGFTDEVTAASFIVRGTATSRKRLYPRRDRLGEYAEFARLQAESGTNFVNIPWSSRQRTADAVTFDRANASLTLKHIGRGIEAVITLKDPSAATSPDTMRARWPVTLVGLHRVGWQLVSDADDTVVATIRPPVITHAGNVELKIPRPVQCEVIDGAVEFTADLSGLSYPIVIDPPIDVTVTVGADDGSDTGSVFSATGPSATIGNDGAGNLNGAATHRFTGISGLSGATIDVSYINVYVFNRNGSPLTMLKAELSATPAQISDHADFAGRSLTTAKADWDSPGSDGKQNSPSLNAVLQEIADSYNPSAIQIFQQNDGGASGNYFSVILYEHGSGNEADLHIEYTAGGGPTVVASRRSLLGVGV